ncbi:unnamed protein product [Rotaria sp. Silwood2]|nr:unnamed protein product [Rotaria sp. Silwood2]CAF3098094.1 unnamed protein product [Rotaria sp. Silwood2]CAF3955686.1 unnamed protein product [Rotaria sp. Silwood2]CAF4135226.1 unnamed protein product [Rotaria sp. Silwood2]CAF4510829.1 unnamed protein product [Rotaria sp. Silwood2]
MIPNTTAGVIIGKGGSTIENIKQDTNASLTITIKSDMPGRVMTVTEDPHHDSVPSVNYSNENGSSINSSSIINDIQPFHHRMYQSFFLFQHMIKY